ncbi:MAG: type II secretion system protein GspI [Rhodocyclaceae bacterium]|nr:MAG: type II secretion system protein GspI [Rhodocyclaceae bacterium]
MKRPVGFTLLEVLVALAIMAIGVAAAMRAIGVATSGMDALRERQLADWVAQNRLAEIRIAGRFPPTGINQGETQMGGRYFVWKEDVKATPNPLFRRVDVAVYASGEDDHALSRLSGFAVSPLQ